ENKAVLVVRGNGGHVIDATAQLVDAVVRDWSGVVVLATSREGLGVAGERIVPVGPLAPASAVTMFLSRARDVRALPDVDGETLGAVEHLCRRLDGIPLAIDPPAAPPPPPSLPAI